MSKVPTFNILDLKIGDTINFTLKLLKDGKPYPTSSLTDIWFTVKHGLDDPDTSAVAQKVLGSGITITDIATGNVRITLSAAETRAIGYPQVLQADVQIKELSGEVSTVCQGTLKFEQDVTKAI